jgi:hypothetical protein
MDAILAFDERGNPVEPQWTEADVTVGNPPFLGGKRLRRDEPDQWERFRVFVSKVTAVPKEEADEKAREYERERDKERAG